MKFIKKIFIDDLKKINSRSSKARLQNIAWPSEASAKLGPINIGSCKRELFYKIIGSKESNPSTVRNKYICDSGLMYEDYHIKKFKESGNYVDDQVEMSFEIPNSRHNIIISGRMDILIKDSECKKIIEVKSVSAYKSMTIMDTKKVIPLPAPHNLMQAMLYKYYCSNIPKGKELNVEEIYLMYINRSDGSTFYYKIDLDEFGYAIITAIDQSGNKIYTLAMRDQSGIDDILNGNTIATAHEGRLAELKISISDIFEGYEVSYDYKDMNSLPPCDFKVLYTQEEVERERKLGRLSTVKYNKSKKGTEQFGDFRCSFCSFRDKCLADSGLRLAK